MCHVTLQLSESTIRWSDSEPSLFAMSHDVGDFDDSISTPSSSRDATPPLMSHDLPHSSTQKSDTLRAITHDDSLVTDITDAFLDCSGCGLFCDCPPDPQLRDEINLQANLKYVL